MTGPAGAGKSQEAKRLIEEAVAPLVVADFQSLYAALILLRRNAAGRYPERNPAHAAYLLPMAEYTRQAIITGAAEMDVDVIATNSDGSPARRAALLQRLGPGAVERILDPGIDVVTQRLSGPDGELSDQCRQAIQRFYGRR